VKLFGLGRSKNEFTKKILSLKRVSDYDRTQDEVIQPFGFYSALLVISPEMSGNVMHGGFLNRYSSKRPQQTICGKEDNIILWLSKERCENLSWKPFDTHKQFIC